MEQKRDRKPFWIAVAAVAVLGIAALAVWYVGRDRFPEGAIFVPRDAATLSDAVSLATEGATIVLDARRGPFSGPVVVDTPGLTITSMGGRATLLGGGEPAVTLRADGITVRHVGILGGSVGLVVEGAGCAVEDVRSHGSDTALLLFGSWQGTFERVTAVDGRVGIDVSASSGNLFREITVRDCTEVGIRVRKARANEFRRVSIEESAVGVSLEESEDSLFAELAVVAASGIGYRVSGGRGNTLEASRIRASGTGAALEETAENRVSDCVIGSVEDVGISLVEARQNRLERNVVGPSAGDGVRFAGGGENGLVDGRLSRCRGTAILVDTSDGNLVARNVISESGRGIVLEESALTRVLGNGVADVELVGILLDRADRNRLLDNRIDGAAPGIALVNSAENSVLRSDLRGCRTLGLALVERCQGNAVTENVVSGASTGILAAASSRDAFQGNQVSVCGVGISIHALGFGVRVAGNRLDRNVVGLRWARALSPTEDAALRALGIAATAESLGGAPIVQNNLFAQSRRYDVENETGELLYAGDNRWGGRDPVVSANVHLPGSAWNGTVVVASGRSLAELVLGRILEVTLSEAGFRVVDLSGLGRSEALLTAIADGDVDLAWWTGAEAPPSALAFWDVQVGLRWDWIVSGEIGRGLEEPSISAFLRSGAVGAAALAVSSDFPDDAVSRLASAYGLPEGSLRTVATGEEAEALLKFGSVSAALLRNLEETATVAGFVRLADDASALPSGPIGVMADQDALRRLPGVAEVFAGLSPHLTEQNLRSMVSRVRLFRREPLDVVTEFLTNEGLIQ